MTTATPWKDAFITVANVRETVPYTLLSGGMAFFNALVIPSRSVLAFWLGAFFGAMVFLRFRNIPRVRGVAYLLGTAVWCWMVQQAGMLTIFLDGVLQ